MYQYNHGIIGHLVMASYRRQPSSKSREIAVEEAHTIHIDHGSDSFADIETVVSEDLMSERYDDFDIDFI